MQWLYIESDDRQPRSMVQLIDKIKTYMFYMVENISINRKL